MEVRFTLLVVSNWRHADTDENASDERYSTVCVVLNTNTICLGSFSGSVGSFARLRF